MYIQIGEDFNDLNFEESLMDVEIVHEQVEMLRQIKLGQGKKVKKEIIEKTVIIYVYVGVSVCIYICLYKEVVTYM